MSYFFRDEYGWLWKLTKDGPKIVCRHKEGVEMIELIGLLFASSFFLTILIVVFNYLIISEIRAVRKELSQLASWILPDHPDKPTDFPF
jgi:hypothetical protein